MSILRVARMGHPVLRQVARELTPDELAHPDTQRLIDDMLQTVIAYDGAGLAAPQVHHSVRVVVLEVDDQAGLEVWVNPVVSPQTDEHIVSFEGCLSVPRMRGAVARPARVRVEGLDRHGNSFDRELQGFPAVVAQHECDHLDGVLYIDRADSRTMAFVEELRRHGPWPWLDEDGPDEDGLDEDGLDEDGLDDTEIYEEETN